VPSDDSEMVEEGLFETLNEYVSTMDVGSDTFRAKIIFEVFSDT